MPSHSYNHTAAYPYGGARYTTLSLSHQWERSPRVNGKLVLRANPWSLTKYSSTRTNYHDKSSPAPMVYPSFIAQTNDRKIQRARAIAESDLRGQLARKIKSKNVGALGVSIATSAQSINMMQGSARSLTNVFEAAEKFYQTTRGKRRLKRLRRLISRGAEPTAGMVLAGFFGWAPLIEDFSNACKTIADPWPAASFLSSKAKFNISDQVKVTVSGFYRRTSTWSASGHSSYSCGVTVSNPNLWVANKLGLVNLPGIAWDLVPWSFLVNMVSNMGQVMGSLTDFSGLALHNSSMTTSLFLTESATVAYKDPRPNAFSSASGSETFVIRGRALGGPPPGVTPYMKFPNWGVGTAAIVGSLLIQQTGRLQKVLNFSR